ncbi:MAG: hypothetical protein WKF47_05045, partial [Geodermatophilaceae bacterium]
PSTACAASTEPPRPQAAEAGPPPFDPDSAYRLHRQAELRDEEFGALGLPLRYPAVVLPQGADPRRRGPSTRRTQTPCTQRLTAASYRNRRGRQSCMALSGLADSQMIEQREAAP